VARFLLIYTKRTQAQVRWRRCAAFHYFFETRHWQWRVSSAPLTVARCHSYI
jgi:hypothetical protein